MVVHSNWLKVFGSAFRSVLKNSIANFSMRRNFWNFESQARWSGTTGKAGGSVTIFVWVTPQFHHSHWRWSRKALITSPVWLRVGRKIPPCYGTIPWQCNAVSNEYLYGPCKVQKLSQDTNDNILLLYTTPYTSEPQYYFNIFILLEIFLGRIINSNLD